MAETVPLRDRRNMIPEMAQRFVQQYARRTGRKVTGISPEALELLLNYSWPGDESELEDTMARAVVMGVSETVLPEDLPENMFNMQDDESRSRFSKAVSQAKRDAIIKAFFDKK